MEDNLIFFAHRRQILDRPRGLIDLATPEELRAIGLLKNCSDNTISEAIKQVWDEEFRQQFYNKLGLYPTLKLSLSKITPNF
jgi:hypothetical protein